MFNQYLYQKPLFYRGFLFLLIFIAAKASIYSQNEKTNLTNSNRIETASQTQKSDSLITNMVDLGYLDTNFKDSLITGEIYSIGKVFYDADTLLDFHENLSGSNFSGAVLHGILYDIALYYAEHGYPFARVFIEGIDKHDHTFDLHIRIITGEQVNISGVYLSRKTKTRKSTIEKMMLLDNDEQFCYTDINKGIRRANRSGIVSLEQGFHIARDERGLWYVALNGKDIAKSSAEGLLAITSSNGEITPGGMLSANLVNIWGGARKFSLKWEQLQEDRGEFLFSAFDPFIMGNVGCGIKFRQKTRETHTDRTFNIHTKIPVSFSLTILSELSLNWITPDSVGLYSYNIPYSQGVGISGGAEYNTLDHPDFPERGILSRLEIKGNRITKHAPSSAIDDELLQDEYNAECDFVFRYVKYFNIIGPYLRVNAEGIIVSTNDDISSAQMTYIGGFNSVRGHLEDEKHGERALYSGLEMRLKLDKRTVIYPFIDYGFVHSEDLEDMYGYGIGISTYTKLGLLQVSYGLNPDRSFDSGLLHFGLIREF